MKKFFFLTVFLACPFLLGAQCLPQLLQCSTPIEVGDITNNNPEYWNQISWWDPVHQSHNLAETETEILLSVIPCPNSGALTARCLLFLDLDSDGVRETVVDSDNPPAPGRVNYANANNPGFLGGTPRFFDQRPIADSLKWRFELSPSFSGDTITYALKWAGANLQKPQLPLGVHKVQWEITEAGAGVFSCNKNLIIKDWKAPTVVCINNLSANIMPTQLIQLWASDFLQYTEDNITPSPLLRIGVRKANTGTGFPVDPNGNPVTSVIFGCNELGPQLVELWSIDMAGNADYCVAQIEILDGNNHCTGLPSGIKVCAETACGADALEETVFTLEAPGLPGPLFDLGPCANFNGFLPDSVQALITPSHDDNPLNGVTTLDLVIILKHVSGEDLFDNPYQWVAADANHDYKIDTSDILDCRDLILGLSQLPGNASWRFVRKDYVFPSPDPLAQPYPENLTVNTSDLPTETIEFVGVKLCDVSCNNIVGFFDPASAGETRIGLPQPNPTLAEALLPLELAHAETVLLEVLDYAGRSLFRSETDLPAGAALLEIPASAFPKNGMYFWRARAGQSFASGKISAMR